MKNSPAAVEATLEVHSPDGTTRKIRLVETPYMIGRGAEGNHLPIADDRVSRKCASVILENNRYYLVDRGNGQGLFINGGKISKQALEPGDEITFGAVVKYSIVFQAKASGMPSIENPPSGLGQQSLNNDVSGELDRLNLLLEATRLLHSQSPLETVLDQMLDRAITVTGADRGLLLEVDGAGSLQPRSARRSGSRKLALETFVPSRTAVNTAIEKGSAVITQDLDSADSALQSARSIVDQQLLSIVAIPLYGTEHGAQEESSGARRRCLGVMYLDSKRKTAFSTLDRQILDVIAIASAKIIENARLAKLAQERQRVEQELNIARGIQEALLPRGTHEFPHILISGMNKPCYEVGGDYFDIFPLTEDRVAFLIGDVSGKGLSAALVTTMLQGAFSGVTTGSAPERIFQHLNTFLCDHAEVRKYATLFFGTIDRDGNLEYVNGGHPSPFVMRRGEVQDLFTEGSLPVGLIPGAEYEVSRFALEPGDTLVLFSDGITEAENRNSELFGEERFRNVLDGQYENSLDRLQKNIVNAVENFAAGTSQGDDITVMLVRYRGPQ